MQKILLTALLLYSCHCYAQSNLLDNSDGLPNRYISSICQTKNGKLWIGTSNGLSNYDGYVFTNYYTYTQGIRLSNSRVNCMYEDTNGKLWVGTNAGINKIDLKNEMSESFPATEQYAFISFCELDKKKFLAGTANGQLFLVNGGTFRKVFALDQALAINNIQIDKNSNILFYTISEGKVYTLNKNYQLIDTSAYTIPGNFIVVGDTLVTSENKSGELLLFHKNNKLKSKLIEQINAQYNQAILFYTDRSGSVWVSYKNGDIIKIDFRTNTFEDYSYALKLNYFGSKINCIYEDQMGLIWIGTAGGLGKVLADKHRFRRVLYSPYSDDPEKCFSTRGMLKVNDSILLISTYKGLAEYNVYANDYAIYLYRSGEQWLQPNPYEFIRWDEQRVLLSSTTERLLFYDLKTHQFAPALKDNYFSTRQVLALYRDQAGIIWVGTRLGLRIYDPYEKILIEPEAAKTIQTKRVWCITENLKNELFIGTDKGLYVLDKQRKIKKHYTIGTIPALSNDEIVGMLSDTNNVWLASRGGGLMHLKTEKNEIGYYNVQDGLPDNIVYGIVKDKDELWLSTQTGLSNFNRKENRFYNYFEKDGIADNEFNSASYLRFDDERIFFGGINGVTFFDPEKIYIKRDKPFIMLNRSSNDTLIRRLSSESENYTATFPYEQKNCSFSFYLSDFYHSGRNTYYYKIEDIDSGWIAIGTQNNLRFDYLMPGKYKLQIKGKNENGIESANLIDVQIFIDDVFYRTTTFRIVLVLVLVFIIGGFIFYRFKQLKSVTDLRIKIARDLHDEVGSLLTRISMLTELFKIKGNEHAEIDKIAQASRTATTTMSDVLWSIDARNDKLANIIDRMREHAESLLGTKGISYTFNTFQLNTEQIIEMNTRQNCMLIFKEAIHNIVKHSMATQVIIQLMEQEGYLLLTIKDNGPGDHANASGSGQGLRNMKMRAKEINADLSITAMQGYRVHLKFKRK